MILIRIFEVTNERDKEYDDESKSESNSKDESIRERNNENRNYISERGSHCTATPASVNRNRTPPPPSQKHHFSQKHQINFCIDEVHRAPSQREGAGIVPNLNNNHYGTSNCKPD